MATTSELSSGATSTTELTYEVTPEEKRKARWRKILPYLLTLPAFIIPLGIVATFVTGVYYSLTRYDLRWGLTEYVGWANYVRLFTQDRVFWQSFWTTVRFTVLALGIQIPLGFAITVLLDQFKGIIGALAQAVIITPLCIAPVVTGLIWRIMMGPTQGVLNAVVGLVGVPPVDWLSDPSVALYSMLLIDIWRWIPFVVLVLWGGWQSLPKAPYEAAAVDGASAWFTFRKLTVPLMSPFLLITVLFRACDALNTFDYIYGTTRGGPMRVTALLNVYAYDNVFRANNLAYGTATAMVVWLLIFFVVKRLMAAWPK